MPPLLYLKDIHLTFGNTRLLDGAELAVGEGERLALVGRNGSGKSTLLKIAAGLTEADSGSRFAQPGATIRYLPQEPSLEGYRHHPRLCRSGACSRAMIPTAPFIFWAIWASAGWKRPPPCRAARRAAPRWRGCWRRRPDILLLDEPTNHLDLPAIEWLEGELKSPARGAGADQP